MPTIDESTDRGYETLYATLAAALKELGQVQTITFFRYTRFVLPLDGYVFYFKSGQIQAKGVLHFSSTERQEEDQTYAVNSVVFTTDQEITQFNTQNPRDIFVGVFQIPKHKGTPNTPPLRFSFSSRGPLMRQAGIYHYRGDAIYPALSTQLVDSPSQVDKNALIVSNSLPAWLALQDYNPPWLNPPNPNITLYPSFLVPDNIDPPYGSVHILPESTHSLQDVPWFNSTNSSRYQLATERVRITLYGCNNNQALDFVDLVANYSRDTNAIGMMDMLPTPRDDKRIQSELSVIAQKKTIEFNISYVQTRINTIARQLIKDALFSVAT